MRKEKIDILFELLNCTNSDLARLLGCAPSSISRVHSGSRHYTPSSRPMLRFAEGVYLYARNHNALPALVRLCGADGEARELLIPSLISWICEVERASLNPLPVSQKATVGKQKGRCFGERLDDVMRLLSCSNMRLALKISIDASAVSRFRNGLRYPKPPISELIVSTLLQRAQKQAKLRELSLLCGIPEKELIHDTTKFSAWLYNGSMSSVRSAVDSMLDSIEYFSQQHIPKLPALEAIATASIINSPKKVYWGTEGLREAVIRFLGSAAQEGGELWLYSDQNMEWMVGDSSFCTAWTALMIACLRRGVKMRIIHNVDRSTEELLPAIQKWVPLYLSGLIEPYVCRLEPDHRFAKTIFLRCGGSCILASVLRGSENVGRYEYLTDTKMLEFAAAQYEGLLANSRALLRVYTDDYRTRLTISPEESSLQCLLSSLSFGTMPKKLLADILARNEIHDTERKNIIAFHSHQRTLFQSVIKKGMCSEYLALPSDEALFSAQVRINLPYALSKRMLFYTAEEYAAHIHELLHLLDGKDGGYELILLPELPFSRIQIAVTNTQLDVILTENPRRTFFFTDPRMIHAFQEYFSAMKQRYATTPQHTRQQLMQFLGDC